MKLFGQIVRTAVNVVTLPVAVAKDVMTVAIGERAGYTAEQLQKIKDEAEEEPTR